MEGKFTRAYLRPFCYVVAGIASIVFAITYPDMAKYRPDLIAMYFWIGTLLVIAGSWGFRTPYATFFSSELIVRENMIKTRNFKRESLEEVKLIGKRGVYFKGKGWYYHFPTRKIAKPDREDFLETMKKFAGDKLKS